MENVAKRFENKYPDLDNIRLERDEFGNIVRCYQVGQYYQVLTSEGTKFLKYLGEFYSINDVPLESCLYSIEESLYYRLLNINKFLESDLFGAAIQKQKSNTIKIEKDDAPLPTTPREEDNVLLIMTKILMEYKNLTENGFKQLFDNASEMNNMKRLLFHGNGELSWRKFSNMVDLLGADVIIRIVDRDQQQGHKVIASNETQSCRVDE